MLTIKDIQNMLSDKPLLVCDIDEVVLEFLSPFMRFLRAKNYDLHPNSFSLNGNIFDNENNFYVSDQQVAELISSFYDDQIKWQGPVDQAIETLEILRDDFDIVFLTAMPAKHHSVRKQLLKNLNLNDPFFASEKAKGPIIKNLHQDRDNQVFFIDDMVYNHRSVRQHLPDSHIVSLMANETFKKLAPKTDPDIFNASNWITASRFLRSKIS